MAMHVDSSESGDGSISAINTTPLVDVMLVLLIIFLITIPVATTSIPVQLPKEKSEAREDRPHNIVVSVDVGGHVYWHDTLVPSSANLLARLKNAASQKPQPEVQIRGDLNADYEGIGKVIHACRQSGIVKIAFITEPAAPGV